MVSAKGAVKCGFALARMSIFKGLQTILFVEESIIFREPRLALDVMLRLMSFPAVSYQKWCQATFVGSYTPPHPVTGAKPLEISLMSPCEGGAEDSIFISSRHRFEF